MREDFNFVFNFTGWSNRCRGQWTCRYRCCS